MKFLSRPGCEIDEPRNRRSRRTRAALLDAAWRLIEERGAERTTLAAIAEEAGVSRRAIYLHFPSRVQLLTALLEHMNSTLDLASSIAPVFQAADAFSALDAWAAHLASFHPRILPVARAVERARGHDPAAAALWDQAMQGWHEACRALAMRLADENVLAEPWTVETAADQIWALMSVEMLEDLTQDRGWSAQRYEELLSVVLRRTFTSQHRQ